MEPPTLSTLSLERSAEVAVDSFKRMLVRPLFCLWVRADQIVAGQKVARLRSRLGHCGDRVHIPHDATFIAPQNTSIGSDVQLGSGIFISAVNTFVSIGNKVMFGPCVRQPNS